MNKFKFRHKYGYPLHSAIGPWLVHGPKFEMTLSNRTEAALLTNALNMREPVTKGDRVIKDGCSQVLIVLSPPRKIPGGEAILVTWESDNQDMRLPDGSIHPAHRHGFEWEEPVINLEYVPTNEPISECEECGALGSQACAPDCKLQKHPDEG